MTTDEGRELLCNIQGPIAARFIAISQARFAAGGSTNIISIFRRSSRPICRSPESDDCIASRGTYRGALQQVLGRKRIILDREKIRTMHASGQSVRAIAAL